MEELKTYKSIGGFNHEFGIPTLHPLIHVGNMEEAGHIKIEGCYSFNFYAVYLKDDESGVIKYGRNYYDYQSGTMLFFAPRRVRHVRRRKCAQQGLGAVLSSRSVTWYTLRA